VTLHCVLYLGAQSPCCQLQLSVQQVQQVDHPRFEPGCQLLLSLLLPLRHHLEMSCKPAAPHLLQGVALFQTRDHHHRQLLQVVLPLLLACWYLGHAWGLPRSCQLLHHTGHHHHHLHVLYLLSCIQLLLLLLLPCRSENHRHWQRQPLRLLQLQWLLLPGLLGLCLPDFPMQSWSAHKHCRTVGHCRDILARLLLLLLLLLWSLLLL
jgi:hypothetical protein